MRGLYADVMDWLMVTIRYMKEANSIDCDDFELNDLTQSMIFKIHVLRSIVHQDCSKDFETLSEQILQNMILSLSWLTRDKTAWNQVVSCQLPFFIWNLKYLVNQWYNNDKEDYVGYIVNDFNRRYEKKLNENLLILCIHLSDNAEILKNNLDFANRVKQNVDKVDIITIAETSKIANLLSDVTDKKILHIHYPMREYFFPPSICNGKYVLDIPKGVVCSNDLSRIITYMLKDNFDIYKNGQGVLMTKAINKIIPFYKF